MSQPIYGAEVVVRFKNTKIAKKLEHEQLDDVVKAFLGLLPGVDPDLLPYSISER